MKIKLNLSEAHFIKCLLDVCLKGAKKEETKLIAQDILNKLNK